MYHRHRFLAVLAAVLLLYASSCKPAEEYSKVAQAGVSYSKAMDALLEAAKGVLVDASSEKILANRDLASTTVEQYEKWKAADVRRIDALNRLQRHTAILGRYFAALSELAGSEVPERTKTSIEGIVKALSETSNDLKNSPFFNSDAVPKLGTVIIRGMQHKALRDELELRKDVIREALAIQQLLSAISADVKQDLQASLQGRERRLVVDPLIALGGPLPHFWRC